jgi:hypothetical protein
VTTNYRVWCISWDETDKEGMDVAGYDPVTDDYKPSSTAIVVPFYNLKNAEDAVLEYARYAHNHRDGYECTWPLTFRVRNPDGSTEDFEVERDYEPTFSACRVSPPADADPASDSMLARTP